MVKRAALAPPTANATRRTARPRQAARSPAAFASAAGYDRSVASVVARIRSGPVTLRQPDE